MEARLTAGNGETEPATLSPSAAPGAARGRQELSRRCLTRQGGFDATRRFAVERGNTGAKPALRQGAFFGDFLVATRKSLARRAGPGNHRQPKAPKTKRQSQSLDPGLRRATNRVRRPRLEQRHCTPPAMAKPSRRPSFCSAGCSRDRRVVASMSEARRASFDPAGRRWSEEPARNRRCGRGASLVTFSSSQESHSPAGARPGQNRQFAARHKQKAKSKALDPGLRRATNRYRPPCPRWRHDNPPAMAKPSRQKPSLLQRRCSPRRRSERQVSNLVGLGRRAGRRTGAVQHRPLK